MLDFKRKLALPSTLRRRVNELICCVNFRRRAWRRHPRARPPARVARPTMLSLHPATNLHCDVAFLLQNCFACREVSGLEAGPWPRVTLTVHKRTLTAINLRQIKVL